MNLGFHITLRPSYYRDRLDFQYFGAECFADGNDRRMGAVREETQGRQDLAGEG